MDILRLFAGSLAFAMVFAVSVPAKAEITLKFGHVGAPGSLFQASADEYAKRVNSKLKGKVKINVFGSSQLGKDKTLLKKLLAGTVDFALPSTVMSSVIDQFGLFEMPYLVKNRTHMGRIEQQLVWAKLAPLVEKKGYKILAIWENGFRHITNNIRPIDKPSDLKNIKLRTPSGKWRVKMFKTYGANPSPLSFKEVFQALKTGVFDGQENPFAQIYSAKFNEVQKYLSLTGHVYTPAYVTVGKKKWARLPADIRRALQDIAKGTQAFVYKTAIAMEIDLLSKLKKGGMKVNTANKKAFVKASGAIYSEFKSTVPGGKELVNRAMALGK
ncbi:MAG: TRAP transporter substrate-binding protein [Alphaproteobacteria bacterium]|nr:TRAP transporter substrate-binding protein [Alphaproteobacteria bacterium]MCZ6496012.1 TRAP transporter substrate-binding protein [Alphaproteobacteria bacterium]MCZ6610723.1 TRAP transporter substrate-binding protein [Alphaproteobacteria bacterium]MCZ6847799.1 TRAP transporter substrate-binding protein [Alphaproteobacteria bacterium]